MDKYPKGGREEGYNTLCEHKWLDTLPWALSLTRSNREWAKRVRKLWMPVLQVPDALRKEGGDLMVTLMIYDDEYGGCCCRKQMGEEGG